MLTETFGSVIGLMGHEAEEAAKMRFDPEDLMRERFFSKAMSESLTDRTEPQSRRGAGEARLGAESLMLDKASRLSKRLCDPKRAYAAHIRRLDMAE